MTIANEKEIFSTMKTVFSPVRNVLVIAPHPDDEVFGCGGTLALLQDRGSKVTTIVVTNGAMGGDSADDELIKTRSAESCAAAKVLGMNEPKFWCLADRGVKYGELLIGRLMEAILATEAELVFLPSPADWHPDHQAIAFAGAEAIRRLGGERQAAFYEVSDPLPSPNLIHDITLTEEKKRRAMHCFKSQLQEQPYDSRISGINNFRALHLGPKVKSAEAFTLFSASDLGKGLAALFDGPLSRRRSLGFAVTGDDLPLVSVIVRSMGRATLSDALDSLVLQTYTNIEVVLVNATGAQHQSVDQWCCHFPVHMIETGACIPRSRAANMGMDAAQGEYLIFLDDDDWFEVAHIQKLVDAIRLHPEFKVVHTGVRCVDGMKKPLPDKFDAPFDPVTIVAGNFIPIHAVLFSCSLLKLGYRLDESLDLYEDWDFWIQLSQQGNFLYVEGLSAVYRISSESGFGVNANPETVELARAAIYRKWFKDLLESQVTSLMSVVRHHPVKEKEIFQLVKEASARAIQIADLNQVVAERDGQIAVLNHLLASRDGQISQLLTERSQILNSISWRITKPLRFLRRSMANNHRHALRRLISDCARQAWQNSGVSNKHKQLIKQQLFSKLPYLFQKTRAYRDWLAMTGYCEVTNCSESDADIKIMLSPQEGVYVPLLREQPLKTLPVRLIAFYLPQFHEIPENNAWWGEGFTEWTNVKPAQPQFKGHYQPRIPGELGYYHLLDSEVKLRQIELARLYGVGGFCFYSYWFGGKLLLEKPVENYLKDSNLDFPFCLCWANENWSRRWDGLDSEILIEQNHSESDDIEFIKHVSQFMRDERYIRIDGKPLLLVYRPSLLPDVKATVLRWREWCMQNSIGEIYLAYTQSFESVNPEKYGFDAAVEFPPNNSSPPNITRYIKSLNENAACTVYDWQELVRRSHHYRKPGYKLFRGVCPSWDNTARRKNRGIIFLNSSPLGYQNWLVNAISEAHRQFEKQDEHIVFVNAWNEWAEGAYLEPDAYYGYAYLEATRMAMVRSTLLLKDHFVTGEQGVAVVIHAYYVDVFVDILSNLENISALHTKLYVTTTQENEEYVRKLLVAQSCEFLLCVVENRGRDILPFLKIMPDVIAAGHEFIVKVHTKKSLHRNDGDEWRKDLYSKLIGGSAIAGAICLLKENLHVGIIGPDGHLVAMSYFWGSNADRVSQLAARIGVESSELMDLNFVAGSMFVARVDAIIPILNLAIDEADFEAELGQTDGTLAHAIERIFSVSAHSIKLGVTCPDKVALTEYQFVKN